MDTPDQRHHHRHRDGWRKSSRSDNNAGACVEIATHDDHVAVRDSKDPAGPILRIPHQGRSRFLDQVTAD